MSQVKRNFFLGSEWLYYKLYMGSRISDIFLTSTLTPIVNELLKQKIISKWFFINYKDPDRHVRIRFKIEDLTKLNYVIETMHKAVAPYLQEKTINKVVVDTYKRELERYGNETIEESESIFFENSRLIAYLISQISNDNERWLWGMKSIDVFLDAWNLTLEQKRDLFAQLKKSFDHEMGASVDINRQLSMKFRNSRSEINTVMSESPTVQFDMALQKYVTRNRQIVSQIVQNRKKESEPEVSIQDLLNSYIHMHCNRLFKSKQRLNEWVLYNYLYQYYRSKVAQLKNIQTKKILINQE